MREKRSAERTKVVNFVSSCLPEFIAADGAGEEARGAEARTRERKRKEKQIEK